MQTRRRNTFTTIRTEGAILPPDLLQRISEGDSQLEGLQPGDYHLLHNEKLTEATGRSWNRLIGAWKNFKAAQEKVIEGRPGTTATRERWLLPLFQELGYGRLQTSTAFNLDGKSYPISHGWGAAPIHLLGFNIALDKRTPGVAGAATTSPHSMVQEFLNRSDEHLWAFLSNGLQLRVLRDNVSLTRQAYVEFDLQAMMEGEVYADFVLLWLLCHQSRVEGEKPEGFWLEQWSRHAQEQGTRALDQLRAGVEEAISALGSGFLGAAANQELRSNLRQGALSSQDYYRQLLRLVYRLIFLFVAEDRELLFPPDSDLTAQQRYRDYYSTQRLRRLAERSRGLRHADLYHVLRLVTAQLSSVAGCPELALPALGGFLFSAEATPDLDAAELPNQHLLDAVRKLAFTDDRSGKRSVDYKNLGPEELGSVYESLLELVPEMNLSAGTFTLTTISGSERKKTGSYYTPSSLIQVLLDSALDPVIADRLKAAGAASENQGAALLDIKVCDPACGSGHFLIAAAHRLARHLAAIRTGDDEPSPEATRAALRDVISHCLYGVDLNPMAVELCKVGLWMEALEPGRPLSFLDAHIKCGNSLVGVGPGLDITEIPDDAFQPAFGDDRSTATALRRRNKREREGQLGFRWDVTLIKDQQDLAQWVACQSQKLEAMPEENAAQIREKEAAYQTLLTTDHYQNQRLEYDLWTAAFFWPIPEGDAETMLAPTQQELLRLHKDEDLDAELTRRVQAIAEQQHFFHWEFEFPTVFAEDDPGFDVVLGNPPWERIKLQEQEFFAGVDPEIANAPNKAARNKLIKKLPKENPGLWRLFEEAKADAENTSYFLRNSGRFPLTAVGDINTYGLFGEHCLNSKKHLGQTGVILPTGIATDKSYSGFFSSVIENQQLRKFIGFVNSKKIFPAVKDYIKFALITFGFSEEPSFGFMLVDTIETRDKIRFFTLSKLDFSLINPNTKTCPIFRNKYDAELTKSIYRKVPVLENKISDENPWDINFFSMFHMSNDSNLFQIETLPNYTRLYEAKMFHQFDHRFGTYENATEQNINEGNLPQLTDEMHLDPYLYSLPRYWIPIKEVEGKTNEKTDAKWLLAFRDITGNTAERTAIFSFIPRDGVGNSAPIILSGKNLLLTSCLAANLNSLVFDFVARQKIAGAHMNFFLVRQLPALQPNRFPKIQTLFVVERVVELSYTAWDLQPFAEDLGYAGPPFRWNEERRALLRAELDALYAHLYGLNRKQLRYILDPADLTPAELEDILDPWEEVTDPLDPAGYAARVEASDFPGETFRVLKEKEIKQYGEYRTRRLVLEAWARLAAVDFDLEAYVPMTDPPPADPSVGHPMRDGSRYDRPGLVVGEQFSVSGGRFSVDSGQVVEEEQAIYESDPIVEEETPEPEESTASTTDWGLYKCAACGQIVMGFGKDEHVKKVHKGKGVDWGKMK